MKQSNGNLRRSRICITVLLALAPAALQGATIIEFSAGITAGAIPLAITTGPDGNLWFTEFLGDRIGRITPAGVVTDFSVGITPGSLPEDIVAGPDGNLWFTEWGGTGSGGSPLQVSSPSSPPESPQGHTRAA